MTQLPSSSYAHLKLCSECNVEWLGGRWHLIPSLSKLWSGNSKWCCRTCISSSNNITVSWKSSIWLLHHWTEGALSKMNAEVLATKLTLTCQINSISKERQQQGAMMRKRQLQVLLDGDKDCMVTCRNIDSLLRSVSDVWSRRVAHCHQTEFLKRSSTICAQYKHTRHMQTCMRRVLPYPLTALRAMLMKQLLFPGITLITRSK